MTENMNVGTYVWAKMKGFKPWPAKIVKPPMKCPNPKKQMHYVFFYGTKDHAWILDMNISPYNDETKKSLLKEKLEDLDEKKKKMSFWIAVQEIENDIKSKKMRSKNDSVKPSPKNNSIKASPAAKGKPSPMSRPKLLNSVKSNSVKSPKGIRKIRILPKPRKNDSQAKKIVKKTIKRLNTSLKRQCLESNGMEPTPKKMKKNNEFTLFCSSSSKQCNFPSPLLSPFKPTRTASTPLSSINHSGLLSRPFVERPELPFFDVETKRKVLLEKKVEASALRFGFLGLGIMGRGIVKNLINSGHQVTVWNRTADKCEDFVKAGAKIGQTPTDVVDASDVTFSCVSSPEVAKELVFGNCGVLETKSIVGKGYIEITSVDPQTSQEISEAIIKRGGRYLEAPVCGSRDLSEDGQLVILAAGDRSLFTRCTSCFQAMGKDAFFLGDVGCGAKINLILHMIMGVTVAALSEGMSLAKAVGIHQTDLMRIIRLGPLHCPLIEEKGNAIIEGKTPTSTPLQHMQNNLNLALNMGNSYYHPLLTAAAANEVYKHAKRLGYEEHDVSAIYMRT